MHANRIWKSAKERTGRASVQRFLEKESVPVDMQKYLNNRLQFPMEELAKHRGEWVARSPDGSRLVTTSRDPELLDALILAAGEDPEECLIEGVPDADCVVGGFDIS